MSHRAIALALVVSSTMLSGICWAQTDANPAATSPMVTGTVAYRGRMALPPDAAIDVRLEDVSRADAPATLVAENIFAAAGKQVPIAFQLPYSAADIQPSHHYQVRARITVGDKLMFTTTQAYPVITNGAPTHVTLMLQPAGGKTTSPNSPAHGGTAAPGKASPAKLQATYWKLTELDGHPSVPATGRNDAHLMLHQSDANFAASSGCNRISGTYELEANSLRLSPGPMTMMACADALMQQEQAFVAALKTVTSYRIDGKTLDLLVGDKVLARFVAVENTEEPK